MKNMYVGLFFMCCFWSTQLGAQITLTSSDYVQVGDRVQIATDSMSALTPGEGGANQIWDFTSLSAQDTAIVSIVDPATTIYADSFPDANQASLVIAGMDTAISYQLITADRLTLLGVGVGLFAPNLPETGSDPDFDVIRFDPPELQAVFPTTFGSSFQDSSEVTFSITDEGATLALKQVTRKSAIIDGWGTVQMPNGNFQALREQVITTVTDSIFLSEPGMDPVFFGGDFSIDTSYNFLAAESKGVLVSFDTRFTLDGEPTDSPYQISFSLVGGAQGSAPVSDFLIAIQGESGAVQFTDQSTNDPTDWMWDFGDGTTSTMQNPTHSYAEGGTYNVCLTAGNEFGSNEVCKEVSLVVTSLNNLPAGTALKIMPNPFSDQLRLRLTNWDGPAAELLIYDATGRLQYRTELRDEVRINTTQWAPGTYSYQLRQADRSLRTGQLLRK